MYASLKSHLTTANRLKKSQGLQGKWNEGRNAQKFQQQHIKKKKEPNKTGGAVLHVLNGQGILK